MGWNYKLNKQIAKALGFIILTACLFVCGCKNTKDETEEEGDSYLKIPSSSNYLSIMNLSGNDISFSEIGDLSSSKRDLLESSSLFNEIDSSQSKKIDFSMCNYEESNNTTNSRSLLLSTSSSSGTNTLNSSETFSYVENPLSKSGYTYNSVNATLRYTGTYCRVYSYNTSFLTSTVYKTIGDKFDYIYPIETNICGKNYLNSYVGSYITPSSDTKIDILIYDINSDGSIKSESQCGIVGYFDPNDFNYYSSNSNKREVFYIDSYWLKEAEKEVYSTLVHEFNHMLNFVNKTCKTGSYNATWFTEMLAMCAEELLQDKLNLPDYYSPKNRLDYFNNFYFYGFTSVWNSSESIEVYSAYANTYSFGAYLLRNFGGAKLFYEMATNNYVNEIAINKALQSLGYNETFYSVLEDFEQVLINYKNLNSELKSLNKNSSCTINNISYSLDKIDLSKSYYSNTSTTKWYGPVFYSYDVIKSNPEYSISTTGFLVLDFSNYSTQYMYDKSDSLTYTLY